MVKGKTYKECVNLVTKTISIAADFVKIYQSKFNKEKGFFITLTFNSEEALKAALKQEIPGVNDKTVNLSRAPILNKCTRDTNNQVKFWDLPLNIDKQDIIRMIEAKFGEVRTYDYT